MEDGDADLVELVSEASDWVGLGSVAGTGTRIWIQRRFSIPTTWQSSRDYSLGCGHNVRRLSHYLLALAAKMNN